MPFIRPSILSNDHAGTIPVVTHAIEWQQQQGRQPAEVCCIYATAPFLRYADLQRGIEVLEETGCDYAFSVTNYAFPIQRAIRVTEQHKVEMLDPAQFDTRSQDLEEVFLELTEENETAEIPAE